MATVLPALDDDLITWIGEQAVFFVATAPDGPGGHVNLSPKGYDTFRVLDPLRVAYLDLTGSGAETIAHLRQNGRLTVMFCAFAGPPRILRLYGRGTVHELGSVGFDELAPHFDAVPGARAIIELGVERVSSSCGFAVPFLAATPGAEDDDEATEDDDRSHVERPTLRQWAARKTDDELVAYRATKNAASIDGLPTIGTPKPSI